MAIIKGKVAQSATTDTNQPKKMQRIAKGQIEFTLDRFRSDIKQAIKNDGYEKYKLRLRHEDHVHIYDSKDMDGKTHEYCDRVLGHTHRVVLTEHEDGLLSISCSPPINIEKVQSANGMKKVERPVRYAKNGYVDPETQKMVTSEWVEDNHVHEWEFLDTVQVSNAKIKEAQNEMAEEMRKVGFSMNSIAAPAAAPTPFRD